MTVRPQVKPRSMYLRDLVISVPDAMLQGDATITGITIDSRDVQPGDLFAALRGSDFDGHQFIAEAIRRGAAAVLCEELPQGIDHPSIIVGDSRRDLAPISATFFGHPGEALLLIGITGTDGKTTTSALLTWILRSAGIQTGVIGTLGVQIGDGTEVSIGHQTTPESHLIQGYLREMVEAGTTAAVVEATSHGLAMHRLDNTPFNVAGVTNITREHLEFHRTIENYRAAKALLIQRVAQTNGVVVLNNDDEGAMSMMDYTYGSQIRTYALSGHATTYTADNLIATNTASEFDLSAHSTRYKARLPLIGDFNVANALCAIGIAEAAGVDIDTAVGALATTPGVPGRMQVVDESQPYSVIVDYAHTPASIEKILLLLRSLTPDGRVIIVSGSAGERDTTKRPLQGKVMGELADIVIITSEDPRNEDPMEIINEIAAGVTRDVAELFTIVDRREAIVKAFDLARPGDVVLLAGKGHESSIIWGFEARPWNEMQVARDILTERYG